MQSDTLTLSLFYDMWSIFALWNTLHRAAAWGDGPSQRTPNRVVRDAPLVSTLDRKTLNSYNKSRIQCFNSFLSPFYTLSPFPPTKGSNFLIKLTELLQFKVQPHPSLPGTAREVYSTPRAHRGSATCIVGGKNNNLYLSSKVFSP